MNNMKFSRNRRLLVGAMALGAASGAGAQTGGDWPSRPVRFIVSFPPGGSNDVIARILARQLQERLGQPVIVDNRPGAGGTIGNAAVVNAPADGHTILLTPANFAITATLYKKLPYDAERDLQGVAFIASAPNVLVVNPSVDARTTAELIALAKRICWAGRPP